MAVKMFLKKRNSNGHKTGPILRGTRDLTSTKQFLCRIKAMSDPCIAPSVFANFSLFRFINQYQFSLIASVKDSKHFEDFKRFIQRTGNLWPSAWFLASKLCSFSSCKLSSSAVTLLSFQPSLIFRISIFRLSASQVPNSLASH